MKATALLLCLLLPLNAFAELKHIPAWKMCGEKACYEFEEAKKLLLLDADLEALIQKDLQWAALVKHLQEGSVQLNLALLAETGVTTTLRESNTKLNELLVKETTRANKAEAKPGPFPAWAIAGGVGVAVGVIAGIVLGVYIVKK